MMREPAFENSTQGLDGWYRPSIAAHDASEPEWLSVYARSLAVDER